MKKREIIQAAFSKIGLGPYAYDAQPEDVDSALSDLNGMMALWDTEGVKVGYPMGDDADLDWAIPDDARQAVINGLALEVAPGFGRTPAPATVLAARRGYNALLRKSTVIPTLRLNTAYVPAGAGYKGTQFLPNDGVTE